MARSDGERTPLNIPRHLKPSEWLHAKDLNPSHTVVNLTPKPDKPVEKIHFCDKVVYLYVILLNKRTGERTAVIGLEDPWNHPDAFHGYEDGVAPGYIAEVLQYTEIKVAFDHMRYFLATAKSPIPEEMHPPYKHFVEQLIKTRETPDHSELDPTVITLFLERYHLGKFKEGHAKFAGDLNEKMLLSPECLDDPDLPAILAGGEICASSKKNTLVVNTKSGRYGCIPDEKSKPHTDALLKLLTTVCITKDKKLLCESGYQFVFKKRDISAASIWTKLLKTNLTAAHSRAKSRTDSGPAADADIVNKTMLMEYMLKAMKNGTGANWTPTYVEAKSLAERLRQDSADSESDVSFVITLFKAFLALIQSQRQETVEWSKDAASALLITYCTHVLFTALKTSESAELRAMIPECFQAKPARADDVARTLQTVNGP